MLSDVRTSIIRTVVPAIVGAVGGFLSARGVEVSPEAMAGLATFLSALFAGLYYVVARLVEQRWPQLGWLLGSKKQPTYDD